jgi:hemolysin activation/secretion protein
MGWHLSALLGKDFSGNSIAPNALWRTSFSKGIQTSASGYLFFNASFDGEIYQQMTNNDRYLLSFSTEYFHKFNDSWGAYAKNTNMFSKNQFLDQPIALGDDSGVRGYPLQYQHGTHATQLTLEARYYPHINIYKMFELGGAAFVDTGKAYGDSLITNTTTSTLASVGIGARLYSTHSSDAKVIHFDIVKPLSSDININSLEFRISTKHSF